MNKKYTLLIAFAIFLVAFSVRLINLETIKNNPYFNYPIMDEKYHDEWAREIAAGDLFKMAPYYRAPAYPYFLGLIYALFGHGYYLPRLIGCIIGALACVLIFLIGKEIFSHKVGVVAGFMACFYSMFLYFDAMLLTVNLEIIFCLLAMYYLIRWLKKRSRADIIGSGLCWGLASITRPNFLIFVPVFIIYAILVPKEKSWKMRLQPIILFLIGMMPAILTVMAINIFIGKDSVPIAWNGGINFYLGNNQFADGWSATSPELDMTWWGGYKDAIVIAERSLGRSLLPSQVSQYWFNRGWHFISTQPGVWIALMVKKIYLLLNTFELSNNQNIQAFKKFSPLLQIPVLNFGVVLGLALWGFICSMRKEQTRLVFAFLLTYAFSIVLFFITARYQMVLVPFMLIFAAYSLFWLLEKASQHKVKKFILGCTVIIATIIFSNTDFYNTHLIDYGEIHFSLGNRFFALHDYEKAINEYTQALRYNSANILALNSLGNTYMMMGRQTEARKIFSSSLKVKKNIPALCRLGIINSQLGHFDSAQIYFDEALMVDSTNPEVYYYAGLHYAYAKKPRPAITNLKTALRYYPDPQYLPSIHYNLGRLYLEIGNLSEAKTQLLEAGINYKDAAILLKRIP